MFFDSKPYRLGWNWCTCWCQNWKSLAWWVLWGRVHDWKGPCQRFSACFIKGELKELFWPNHCSCCWPGSRRWPHSRSGRSIMFGTLCSIDKPKAGVFVWGDCHKAIEYHERDLEIAKEVGDHCSCCWPGSRRWPHSRSGRSIMFGTLCSIDKPKAGVFVWGDCHKAIEYHERDLEIAKEVGDKAGEF